MVGVQFSCTGGVRRPMAHGLNQCLLICQKFARRLTSDFSRLVGSSALSLQMAGSVNLKPVTVSESEAEEEPEDCLD